MKPFAVCSLTQSDGIFGLSSTMLEQSIAEPKSAVASVTFSVTTKFSPENSHPADEVTVWNDLLPVVNSGIDWLMFYTNSINLLFLNRNKIVD